MLTQKRVSWRKDKTDHSEHGRSLFAAAPVIQKHPSLAW
jgi:hypothetical protein